MATIVNNQRTPRERAKGELTKTAETIRKGIQYVAETPIIGGAAVKASLVGAAVGMAATLAYFNLGAEFGGAHEHYSFAAQNLQLSTLGKGALEALMAGDMGPLSTAWNLAMQNKYALIYVNTVGSGVLGFLSYVGGENGKRSYDIVEGAPINLYRKALEKIDLDGVVKRSKMPFTNFSGKADLFIQNAVNNLRTGFLGKHISGHKTNKYHQGELNMLHSLVLMNLFKDEIPEMDALLSHKAFDKPEFDFIFSNTTVLSKILEANIDNFANFAHSMYRSLEGYELDIFTPDNDLPAHEHEASNIAEFNEMTMRAMHNALIEINQRKVMSKILDTLGNEIRVAAGVSGGDYATVDKLTRLHKVMDITTKAIMEYDEGHEASVYSQLYEPLEKAKRELRVEITNAPGDHLIDISTIPVLNQWVSDARANNEPKARTKAMWESAMPDLSMEANVSGLAAKNLLQNVYDNVNYKHLQQQTQNRPDDVVLEVSKRALYDMAASGGMKR